MNRPRRLRRDELTAPVCESREREGTCVCLFRFASFSRYAWFATRTDQSDGSAQKHAALMDATTDRNLTALGAYYNSSTGAKEEAGEGAARGRRR